ncbi:uncharacterized protein DEA37_0014411 [Paragonimus westermani]|uniref:SOCS box domain-containing protein n=1 Tax=Paragonimus westermani TaxID=34504 RepID=A0A5J4NW44_9TREM|nr:uncharacterized protein DEA37_0014411 [Paragonimus westermani]
MGLKYSKQRHKPRISKSQIPWLLRGAIRSNNVETLQYLFSYPNKVDPSMVIDGVCPLNLAVELGHLQMVKILIKAGADIYVADAPRYPLHQASLFGRGPVAELLLRSGASVSALTERRQSCLHLLSHQSAERFLETAHILMRHNANPNTLDDDGLAPLHRASVEMVTVLASYEVTDLNISSRDGDTPLLTAVKDRRELVVLALLRADQQYREQQQERAQQTDRQLEQQTTGGKQPVCRTVSTVSGVADEDDPVACDAHCSAIRTSSAKSTTSTTSRLTLASAASAVFRVVTTYDQSGVMRASSAASVNLHSVHRKSERREKLRRKVSRKEDGKLDRQKPEIHATPSSVKRSDTAQMTELNMNTLCTRPTTAVVASSYSGSTNLFATFRKAENCQRCHSVGNPSDVSGWWQSCDRLQRLLTKAASTVHQASNSAFCPSRPTASIVSVGSPPPPVPVRPRLDLNRPDKIGMTALMIAAEAGNSGLNMIIALVQAGCNVAATDKVGMTALHHACYVGSLPVAQYLLERVQSSGNHSGPASASHLTGSPKLVQDRPSRSSSITAGRVVIPELLDAQDKYGRTPIYLAACRGHTEAVNYLLSRSADFHMPNREHKSPLYISAYFGYLEIANALLRHGAQVDQMDSHRKTALYVATYHGRSEIVDLLLAAGANVNAADKNGKTPLYIAVLHGHLALAQKLLNAGASVNRVDREGLGPLHMAVKFPKLDIPMVKLLLNYGCDPVNLASFTRWLLMHGIIPQECIHGDDELAQWLRWEECNVRSLKRICRVAIQRAMGNSDSMRWKIRRLPLPEHLLSYVSMKEL